MTPTGRLCVGRSCFLPRCARERARDEQTSEFVVGLVVGRRRLLGGRCDRLPDEIRDALGDVPVDLSGCSFGDPTGGHRRLGRYGRRAAEGAKALKWTFI